jgi:hypothetical protein
MFGCQCEGAERLPKVNILLRFGTTPLHLPPLSTVVSASSPFSPLSLASMCCCSSSLSSWCVTVLRLSSNEAPLLLGFSSHGVPTPRRRRLPTPAPPRQRLPCPGCVGLLRPPPRSRPPHPSPTTSSTCSLPTQSPSRTRSCSSPPSLTPTSAPTTPWWPRSPIRRVSCSTECHTGTTSPGQPLSPPTRATLALYHRMPQDPGSTSADNQFTYAGILRACAEFTFSVSMYYDCSITYSCYLYFFTCGLT